MQFAVALSVVAVCLSPTGCAGESSTQSGEPAGKVVELTGSATASRPGKTERSLKVAAHVFADDTVETGENAKITIELAHNNARWVLSGGLSRRVDQSAAWRVKTVEETALASNDENRTGAAGRHTERESAQTEASRGAEREHVAAKTDKKTGSGTAHRTRPKIAREDTGEKDKNKVESSRLELRISAVRSSADGGLEAAAVRRTVRRARAAVVRCAAEATVAAQVRVTLTVSPGGSVSSAEASPAAGKEFADCAARALRSQTFDSADQATTVQVDIELSAVQ